MSLRNIKMVPNIAVVPSFAFHFATNLFANFSESLDFSERILEVLITLESGINVPLRLLIFGIFSRGYGLITDLKDLNFTT